MIPTFDILGRTISVYMIAALAGIFAVLYFAYRTADKHKLDPITMMNMILLCFIGIVVGGKLLYGLTNIEFLIRSFGKDHAVTSVESFFKVLYVAFGGSVFYGGLLGALLVFYICRKRKRLEPAYQDIGAIIIPLFHTFGRIGCFLGGCCYGVECRFGVVYRYSPLPGVNGVRRLPVQLFEAAFNLALFLVLYHFFRKKKYESWLLYIYLYAYPVFRFVIEFIRGDEHRGIWWGLSTSQWISLALLIGNTIVVLRRKHKKAEIA